MAEALGDKIAANLQTVCETVQKYEQSDVQDVQKEVLAALYSLQDTMQEEIKEVDKVNYRVGFMQKKLQQTIFDESEKNTLKQENQKLKYRIQFLLNYIKDNKIGVQ